MKGIVFTDFLEVIEEQYGCELVDQLLAGSELPSGGLYTAVGTYDHTGMTALVHNLSQRTNLLESDLLCTYRHYMFGTFTRNYRPSINRTSSAFTLLHSVDH